METWILYAIAGIFFGGLKNFGLKVIGKQNYNASLVSIYSFLSAALFSGLFFLYLNGFSLEQSFLMVLAAAALLKVVLGFLSTLTKVESLVHIDSVIFFPLQKTGSLLVLTAFSVFFFGESLNTYELIGLFIGLVVPLFLITKEEKAKQNNLKRGIVFLLLTLLLTIITSLLEKQINVMNFNIELFTFFAMLFGVFVSSISYKFFQKSENKKKNIVYNQKGIIFFGLTLGILHFLTAYCFVKSLSGNLAIAYTINTFSILIPIILSVIFYKEEMTFKKAFVIFLSIVSVILFI